MKCVIIQHFGFKISLKLCLNGNVLYVRNIFITLLLIEINLKKKKIIILDEKRKLQKKKIETFGNTLI